MTRSLAFLALALLSGTADAAFTIDASVGGAPTGVNYVNFNNLSGSTPGSSGGIGVTYSGGGQAVQFSSSGLYAAPYISNSNGSLFGDPTVSGEDKTPYLTTGTGSVTLELPGPQKYFGLLWGSVDTYNSLSFYGATGTLLKTYTGADVTAAANGNQGASGTFYVNINSTEAFTRVVASSSSNAFEFDNVAYNPTAVVPEPSSVLMLGSGLALALCYGRRKFGK